MGPQALYDAIQGLRWDLIGLHIVDVNMISNYDIFSGRTYSHLKFYDPL